MNIQQQINKLAIAIANKTAFNSGEIESEKIQRQDESLQIQADIVESVVDEYNTVIGG